MWLQRTGDAGTTPAFAEHFFTEKNSTGEKDFKWSTAIQITIALNFITDEKQELFLGALSYLIAIKLSVGHCFSQLQNISYANAQILAS